MIPYYLDSNKLWIKDDIAPFGVNIYYVQEISGYSSNSEKVFKFIDNFNDNSIDTSKWFTDGVGVIEEINGTAHIVSNNVNTYPRFVTTNSIDIKESIIEYDVKITGVAQDSCRIGSTSYYIDGNNTANWYMYTDINRKLKFWTRINNIWALRWTSNIVISLDVWYKIKFIETSDTIKLQLLNSSNILLDESEFISYDAISQCSIYFGQRSTGDSGYFDNFIIHKYTKIEPTITVTSISNGYQIKVQNNSNEELRDYSIGIPTVNMINISSSLYITYIYKTSLKQPYYNINNNCILSMPYMNLDITGNHSAQMFNTTTIIDKFNNISNATMFDGINSRGIIYNQSDLNIFNGENFTLNIWIKQLLDYSSTRCVLLAKAANINNISNRWILQINNNDVYFLIQDCNEIFLLNPTNTIKINDNNWHMLTFVRNGSYLYTYKDGINFQNIHLNICNFSNDNNVDIGCCMSSVAYDYFFNGVFGQIALYNNAFNMLDIYNYYDITKNKYISNIITERQY